MIIIVAVEININARAQVDVASMLVNIQASTIFERCRSSKWMPAALRSAT
jgi:hypothetical protein